MTILTAIISAIITKLTGGDRIAWAISLLMIIIGNQYLYKTK